jgi:hypothetical protein
MSERKRELSEEERKRIEEAGIGQLRNFGKLLNIGKNIIQKNIGSFGEIIKN